MTRPLAWTDYAQSIRLFPTAESQISLGQIAQLSGDTNTAKQYFALAAQAKGPTGEQARQALLKLDPPRSTNNALLLRQGLTKKGTLAVSVTNQTSRPITGVVLGFQSKRTNKTQPRKVGTVRPGASRLVDTGLKVTPQQLSNYKFVVLQAQVGR